MPFHGELSIGFLQVIVFGISFNLQNLVVIDAHASLRCLSQTLRVFRIERKKKKEKRVGFLCAYESAFWVNLGLVLLAGVPTKAMVVM